MHATTVPAVGVEPVAALTERGAQLVSLIRCRDILPSTTSAVIRAAIETRITALIAEAHHG